MELSERFIQKLEAEGFDHVYEWQDAAGAVHEEHSHSVKNSVMVTDGSITFVIDGKSKELKPGDRIDIAANQKHSAVVGEEGAIYIVGEKQE